MRNQTYELFGEFAARYDLHTPPGRADHEFILEEMGTFGPEARVLDVGCGTGALLEALRGAGLEAQGIDAAPEMVGVAEKRLGTGVVRVARLQELREREAYDAFVSLAMPFNYCADVAEAQATLASFHGALRPGGLLLMQVVHAPNCLGHVLEDWVAGPGGERDVQFLYQFLAIPGEVPSVRAQYIYSCRSLRELCAEVHTLNVADVHLVAELMRKQGFIDIRIYGNSRREPLLDNMVPFVLGTRPGEAWTV